MPPSGDAAFFARVDESRKSRRENPWLNGLGLDEDDLERLQGVQNTYVVQLDAYPDSGYGFNIWLLWDYDRLWGHFNLGYTKGLFLVDPGVNLSLCDDDGGQELPFTWRGFRKADPSIIFFNEHLTKGKTYINPYCYTLEGFFEFMRWNGDAGFEGERCAFHAKSHFGPRVVPYTLEETVELWNDYIPFFVPDVKVRQFLSPSDLAADLRNRDGDSITTPNDEEGDDDTSSVSQEFLDGQETVGGEVFDNYGRRISVVFLVDRESNLVSGWFDGDFRDIFRST